MQANAETLSLAGSTTLNEAPAKNSAMDHVVVTPITSPTKQLAKPSAPFHRSVQFYPNGATSPRMKDMEMDIIPSGISTTAISDVNKWFTAAPVATTINLATKAIANSPASVSPTQILSYSSLTVKTFQLFKVASSHNHLHEKPTKIPTRRFYPSTPLMGLSMLKQTVTMALLRPLLKCMQTFFLSFSYVMFSVPNEFLAPLPLLHHLMLPP